MYKLKYNFLTWLILKLVKIKFNMCNNLGYKDGEAIEVFHSGNMNYKHAIEIRKSIFKNVNNLIDKYNEEGERYCIDYSMLEYL